MSHCKSRLMAQKLHRTLMAAIELFLATLVLKNVRKFHRALKAAIELFLATLVLKDIREKEEVCTVSRKLIIRT